MLHVEAEKRYGSFQLQVAFEVREGETLGLVGPTGCGKTTTLLMIAGIVEPDRGSITFGGRVLWDGGDGVSVPPEKRQVGLVFQDYALFPHINVFENVAYGLRNRGIGRRRLREAVDRALDLVGIAHLAGRRPTTLSGGEQQRVAVARAVAIDPPLLLFDEPIAALDPQTRQTVRRELRRVINTVQKTSIVVTHDPIDAFSLVRRLCVLESGKIQQIGEREELLLYPKTGFVAEFVGTNFFRGKVINVDGDGVGEVDVGSASLFAVGEGEGEILLSFLPSDVTLSLQPPSASALNVFRGSIQDIVRFGDRVRILVESSVPLVAEITERSCQAMGLKEGSTVYASFKATAVRTARS